MRSLTPNLFVLSLLGGMVASMAVVITVVNCTVDDQGPGADVASLDEELGFAEPRGQATLVRVQPVERGTYDRRTYVVHGVTHPYKQVHVGFEQPGLVTRVNVVEGQRVAAGATLAQLDTAAAELAHSEAQLALEQAQADWERISEAKDSFTDAQVDDARRGRDRAEVAVARAALSLQRSRCLAPEGLHGKAVVERLHVEPGEVVAAGQPVLTLIDDARLRVKLRLPGRIVRELRAGESVAHVRLRDADVAPFAADAPITRISTVADAVRQYEVELELANEARNLRPGLVAEVTLALPPLEGVTVLPMGAVTRQGDEYLAWFATANPIDRSLSSSAGTEYRAVRFRFPVEGTALWHNDLVMPAAPPHDLLIVEGYQSLLDKQPVRLERE